MVCIVALLAFDVLLAVHGFNQKWSDHYNIWIVASGATTLVYNVSLTLAIVGRLMWVRGRGVRIPGDDSHVIYKRVTVCLIESGALYSTMVAVYTVSSALSVRHGVLILENNS